MRAVRTGLKLRMELCAHKPRVIRKLHHFNNPVVRGSAAEYDSGRLQAIAVIVVHLVTMAVALRNQRLLIVQFRCLAASQQLAGIFAKAHGSAQLNHILLLGHQIDDRVAGLGIEFSGIRVLQAKDMAAVFHNRHLHAKTNAQKRYLALTRIPNRGDLALDPALAKAAGYQNALHSLENLRHIFGRDQLGIDPADIHLDVIADAAVGQRFGYAQVGVVQIHIFAHHGNRDGFRQRHGGVDHFDPFRQIRAVGIQAKVLADNIIQPLFFQSQRHGIQQRKIQILDHAVFFYITEQGNLLLLILTDRQFGTENNNIGLNSDGKQLFYAVLSRLCFLLVRRGQIRHQRHVDKQAVIAADLCRKLTDRL